MNNKVRLLALKTMLSAKLYEDKLIFIDSEQIELPKTQLLDEIINPFKKDKLCFLTSQDIDENFKRASSNLNLVHVKQAQQFHIMDLLKNDYIFITKQGLEELE
jgi:large subunit ribosomal protein L4